MIRLPVACLILLASIALVPARAQPLRETAYRAEIDAIYPVMIQAIESGAFTQARNICDQVILWDPANPVHRYNLACIESRAGRKPAALAALRHAAELGFAVTDALQKDPDLEAIRGEPEFAQVAHLIAANAATRRAAAPAPDSQTAVSPRGVENLALVNQGDPPAPARFAEGVPVGLFFMTRYWPATRSLEKSVWYFAPDGTVYQGLEAGFSVRDLAQHNGPKGKATLEGNRLEVVWPENKKSGGGISRSAKGFSWNAGIFTEVKPFTAEMPLAGIYEGGESISFSGNRAAIAKTIELREDGTYRWSGVSFLNSASDITQVTAGSNGEDSTGRWHAGPYSLVLVDAQGHVYRRIAFPYDDETTPITPDRIFFGGTLFKRR